MTLSIVLMTVEILLKGLPLNYDLLLLLQGTLIDPPHTLPSKEECVSLCHADKSCNWWSFNEMELNCLNFENCPELDESYDEFVSGQVGCYEEPMCKFIRLYSRFETHVVHHSVYFY